MKSTIRIIVKGDSGWSENYSSKNKSGTISPEFVETPSSQPGIDEAKRSRSKEILTKRYNCLAFLLITCGLY